MQDVLPNPYLLALGVSIISYFLIWGLKLIFTIRVAKFVGSPINRWDEIVVFTAEKTSQFFILTSAIYLGLKFAGLPKSVIHYSNLGYFIIFMWQVAIWSHYLLEKWISSTIKQKTRRNPAAAGTIGLIQLFGRLILFTIIFLFTLSNLGIKVTTIIAGIGFGGIAVALGLQKILGDLFSSLSIVLDKPFVVGDFIMIDQYMGEVERIGLKTTRLRSLSGEQIVFSNSDLLATRIRNYKRMHERRVIFVLNLPHKTSSTELKNLISQISAIIRSKSKVRFERCHFMRMNSSSHDVEIVYWVLSDDYDLYMDIHQGILFDIKNVLETENIVLAYPTQTLNMLPTEILMRSDQSAPVTSVPSVDSTLS